MAQLIIISAPDKITEPMIHFVAINFGFTMRKTEKTIKQMNGIKAGKR